MLGENEALDSEYNPSETSRFTAIDAAQPSTSSPQRPLSAEELAAVESLPAGSALLIAQSGPNSGARFLLDADETLAGRHVKAGIFLDDVTVSRRHAYFLRQNDGQFIVRDSGSLNGTYVNRERIDETMLNTGDEVQIGKFRLVFYGSQAEN